MKRSLLTLALCTIFGTAHADAPARFPAVGEAAVENLLRNVQCRRRNQSSVARIAAETQSYRGYAVRVCGPENESLGAIVLWINQSPAAGRSRFTPTLLNGTPLPMGNDGRSIIDGDQQLQWVVFGYPASRSRVVACGAAVSNWRFEPWAATFCDPLPER